MLFSAWSPFGPIFGKELRTASRRKRNYLLRVVYLGTLLLFLLWAYAITRSSGFYRGASAQAQQNEQLGWLFFMFFSMFTVIAMGLVSPVLTSTAINSERLHKTLHVLLMTPLTAWQIVSGKMFSRLLTALTLIGLTLPVLALVRLLGGVELQQMFGVLCLCIVTAMTGAALGLLLSILLQRAYAVILMSYLIFGVAYLFAPMIILMYASAYGRMGGMRWMSAISNGNPFWATAFLASGQSRVIASNWMPCVLIHLGVTAVLLFVSALLVRRLARREGEGATALGPPAMAFPIGPPPLPMGNGEPQIAPHAAPIAMPMRAARYGHPGRTVSDYPVLWRELRRPLMLKTWQRIVGVVVGAAMLALTYGAAWANNALKDDDFHIAFGVISHTLLLLLACVLSATAIAQEKEGDTWTVLLASPLSGAAIVGGKTLGVLRRLLWPMVLIFAHFAAFTLFGVISPGDAVLVLWVMVTFNLIWLASGIYLSLLFRKVTIAVIACLGLPVALYGGLSLIGAVIDVMFDFHGDLVEQATWYLPYYYVIELLSRRSDRGYDIPGDMGNNVPFAAFAAVALFVGVLHIAVTALILWLTAKRFDRIVGRAPQAEPLAGVTGRPRLSFAPEPV